MPGEQTSARKYLALRRVLHVLILVAAVVRGPLRNLPVQVGAAGAVSPAGAAPAAPAAAAAPAHSRRAMLALESVSLWHAGLPRGPQEGRRREAAQLARGKAAAGPLGSDPAEVGSSMSWMECASGPNNQSWAHAVPPFCRQRLLPPLAHIPWPVHFARSFRDAQTRYPLSPRAHSAPAAWLPGPAAER